MALIFIELFNYRPTWNELPRADRQAFTQGVLQAVTAQCSDGVEVLGWGFNDLATDRRAPYDFYCVYRVPSATYQRQFEREIENAGWYKFFEQINVTGAPRTPAELLEALASIKTPGPTNTAK